MIINACRLLSALLSLSQFGRNLGYVTCQNLPWQGLNKQENSTSAFCHKCSNDRKHNYVVGQFYPWWEMLIIFSYVWKLLLSLSYPKTKERKFLIKGKIEPLHSSKIYCAFFVLKTFVVSRSVGHTDCMLQTLISSCRSMLIATRHIKFHIGSCMNAWILTTAGLTFYMSLFHKYK